MRDRLPILVGLFVFVALVTVPFWHGRAATKDFAQIPGLKLPVNSTQCVAPVEYMRKSHMQLLVNWREDVVRRNDRQYHAFNGKTYEKSLTRTCLGCHTNRADFCDRCHTYTGVSGPYCWDCHNQPQVNIARRVP
jgi:hypothetical protein